MLKPLLIVILATVASACGGGGGGGDREASFESEAETLPSSIAASSEVESAASSDLSSVAGTESSVSSSSSVSAVSSEVNLQGRVTFDRVNIVGNSPFSRTTYLDYDNIEVVPARGVTVQLLNSLNQVVEQAAADANGEYSFMVGVNQPYKVRVKTELSGSNYSITVRDNTQNDAEYVLDGSLLGSGNNATQTRDLHAASGWDAGSKSYASQRQSAPFAILDTIYDSLQMVLNADASVTLPPLSVFWSVNNKTVSGSFSAGNIGSSLYGPNASAVYVLGDDDDDTDEFDRAVVAHEFGHYLEDKLSRSESIGGLHYIGRPVDMRVAFGEGFGNAFAAMSNDDSRYMDTYGPAQESGFGFDVEANNFGDGFYMEGAVHSILLDIFDENNESGDVVSTGFAPILQALRHDDYITFEGFTSIHSFISVLKGLRPSDASAIDSLLSVQSITVQDRFGTGETEDADVVFGLPVYHRISVGQSTEVCSDNQLSAFGSQEYNGFEVNRNVLLDIPSRGNYEIRVQRSRGLTSSDPDMVLYREGIWVGARESDTANLETWSRTFEQGTYVITVHEASNSDDVEATGGLVCFNVTLQ